MAESRHNIRELTDQALSPTHRKPPESDTLSFVVRNRPRGSGYNYWNVETTGNFTDDCDKGRELAAEYFDFLRRYPTYGNASLLQCIVGSMIDRATLHGRAARGIEVGFLQAVNQAALVGVTQFPAIAAA